MIVRNYREVKAELVAEEPGVAVHWLVSQPDEAPTVALSSGASDRASDSCRSRLKTLAINPFASSDAVARYETWYETPGRRADRLERALLERLLAGFPRASTFVEVRQARDPKGIWERADRGQIATLPGSGVPCEPPDHPEVRVDTAHLSIEEAARRILGQLHERAFSPVGTLWVR